MSKIVILVIFLFLTACSTKNEQSLESTQTDKSIKTAVPLNNQKFSFSLFSCPNSYCSPYTVFIENNKMIKKTTRNKKQNVESKILLTESRDKLEQLVGELNFTNRVTLIKPGMDSCGSYSSDFPNYKFKQSIGRFSKEFEVYAGCHKLPKPLLALVQWFRTESEKPFNTKEF